MVPPPPPTSVCLAARAGDWVVPETEGCASFHVQPGQREAVESLALLVFLAWEGVLGHRVEVPHEEDGKGASGEEQDGHPEAQLVYHLPNQHPVLDLLEGEDVVQGQDRAGNSGGSFSSWRGPTHRPIGTLVLGALGDEVASIHTFLDLWCQAG